MKRSIWALVSLALFVPGAAAKSPHRRLGCSKRFTVRMDRRAARAVYRGTHRVTLRNLRLLGYLERCELNPRAQGFVRSYNHRLEREHATRVQASYEQRMATSFPYDGWAIPAKIVYCESNYENLSPNGAGASGYYQIVPGTWTSNGGSRYSAQAYEASRYEQGVIAGNIWRSQGSSPWSSSESCWG